MKHFRPYRFPSLAQVAAQRAAGADEGGRSHEAMVDDARERGYQDGYELGLDHAREVGLAEGRGAGLTEGRRDGVAIAREDVRRETGGAVIQIDALVDGLRRLQEEYQTAMRKDVVDLVEKVARQVVRCELALQPGQILSLVDESLATLPPGREDIEVFLNADDLRRIAELEPDRVTRWHLLADASLEPGECRIRAGRHEVDAGCRQRLAACMERVSAQLLGIDALGLERHQAAEPDAPQPIEKSELA